MSHFENNYLPHWVKIRILDFLNRAQQLEDITRSPQLKDNPESGSQQGYIIGQRVAQRIIDHRAVLPQQQYTSLDELKEIKGIGEDKIHDLAYSFQTPAADAFRQALYTKGILPKNWRLVNHTTHFQQETAFREIIDYRETFLKWVSQQVVRISQENHREVRIARLAGRLLRKCYLDAYPAPHYGAIALAFWFYRIHADQWFSFDRIRTETDIYLSTYPAWQHRLELYLFKDFPNADALSDSMALSDLPVIINHGEWAITLWTLEIEGSGNRDE